MEREVLFSYIEYLEDFIICNTNYSTSAELYTNFVLENFDFWDIDLKEGS